MSADRVIGSRVGDLGGGGQDPHRSNGPWSTKFKTLPRSARTKGDKVRKRNARRDKMIGEELLKEERKSYVNIKVFVFLQRSRH